MGGLTVSVWLDDFGPCATGQDRYIVYLRANTSTAQESFAHADGERGGLGAEKETLEEKEKLSLRVISRADMQKEVDGGKVWIVKDGLVLDATAFLDKHPGGPQVS